MDEKVFANVQRVVSELQQLLQQATITQKEDDIEVCGNWGGRATTITVDMNFGDVDVSEMQTRCAVPERTMTVNNDRAGEPKRIPGAVQAPDDFGDFKEFLTKTVYLDGTKDELATWRTLLEKLPCVATIFAWVEASDGRLSFAAKRISSNPRISVAQPDAVARLREHLEFLATVAAATEASWRGASRRKQVRKRFGALAGALGVPLILIGFMVWQFGRDIPFVGKLLFGAPVHGSLVSEGGKLGTWTVGGKAWDSCQSGEREQFLGVSLFKNDDDQAVLTYVQDAGNGPTLKIGIPNSDKAYSVGRADCSVLDCEVHRTHTQVNDVWDVEGHARFDCTVAGGRVHGDLTFENCH